jgi:predicted site-specific integrase-resolvase
MKKEELLDLITLSEAAELRGVSQQAISDLMRRGRLHPVEIAGRKFLKRSEVASFQPEKSGRPAKAKKGKAKK